MKHSPYHRSNCESEDDDDEYEEEEVQEEDESAPEDDDEEELLMGHSSMHSAALQLWTPHDIFGALLTGASCLLLGVIACASQWWLLHKYTVGSINLLMALLYSFAKWGLARLFMLLLRQPPLQFERYAYAHVCRSLSPALRASRGHI